MQADRKASAIVVEFAVISNTHTIHKAAFPAHHKEHVFVPTRFCKRDQKDEEVPNDFNLNAPIGKRPNLLVNEDDGSFGKGMRLGLAG
jgi:hypothetical protein